MAKLASGPIQIGMNELKEAFFAVEEQLVIIDTMEKAVVKLANKGDSEHLYEKRQELQWCRNSLASAQLKLSELSKRYIEYICKGL